MPVKPELAFDVCWDVYKGARERLEEQRGVSALALEQTQKFLYRPDMRPKLCEWTTDFALAGKAALAEWPSRLILFRVYYVGLATYENARKHVGIGEMGFVQWTEDIRNRVGAELLRRRMFPPRGYFGS